MCVVSLFLIIFSLVSLAGELCCRPEGCVEPLPQCEVERMDKAIKCVLAAVKPMIGRLANLLTDPPQVCSSVLYLC